MTFASCFDCQTLFSYEERDLFSGEIYCPACTSRTDNKHRKETLKGAKKAFPNQAVYQKKSAS